MAGDAGHRQGGARGRPLRRRGFHRPRDDGEARAPGHLRRPAQQRDRRQGAQPHGRGALSWDLAAETRGAGSVPPRQGPVRVRGGSGREGHAARGGRRRSSLRGDRRAGGRSVGCRRPGPARAAGHRDPVREGPSDGRGSRGGLASADEGLGGEAPAVSGRSRPTPDLEAGRDRSPPPPLPQDRRGP